MRGKIVLSGLVLALSSAVSFAQSKPVVPNPGTVYCSGIVSNENVPRKAYVITGEESNYRIVYNVGDDVFFNRGSDDGVKEGDTFQVVRPVEDPYVVQWTAWEHHILRKMGTVWADEGRITVVTARPKVSIARVQNACDFIQRGDLVLPFTERATPSIKV
ncbi:MAG: hypothetical protein KGL75_09050, partial [Acidobacteriota bacterium]|nr:hypothetical protein [Acidobacteriota bacterium]